MNDPNGWQAIDSAPKDGTPIYVHGPDPAHGKYAGYARWNGYCWRKLHRQGFLNMVAYPTHWRPATAPADDPDYWERRKALKERLSDIE